MGSQILWNLELEIKSHNIFEEYKVNNNLFFLNLFLDSNCLDPYKHTKIFLIYIH